MKKTPNSHIGRSMRMGGESKYPSINATKGRSNAEYRGSGSLADRVEHRVSYHEHVKQVGHENYGPTAYTENRTMKIKDGDAHGFRPHKPSVKMTERTLTKQNDGTNTAPLRFSGNTGAHRIGAKGATFGSANFKQAGMCHEGKEPKTVGGSPTAGEWRKGEKVQKGNKKQPTQKKSMKDTSKDIPHSSGRNKYK